MVEARKTQAIEDKAREAMAWILGGFLAVAGVGLVVLALQKDPELDRDDLRWRVRPER